MARLSRQSIHPFFSWVFRPRLRASYCTQCWEFPTSESLPTVNVLRDLETRPHSALLGFGLSSSEAENQAWC